MVGLNAKWRLDVYYLDARSCNWGCSCRFKAPLTHGTCESVSGFHIKKGSSGKVILDNLNAASIGKWPGPIHAGHGRIAYYIDSRATDEQFEQLGNILTGKLGGPFEVDSMSVEKRSKPRRAVISIIVNGPRSGLKIETFAEVQLEPVKGQIAGEAHDAEIGAPEAKPNGVNQASTKRLRADNGDFKFDYSGSHASFRETSWLGP